MGKMSEWAVEWGQQNGQRKDGCRYDTADGSVRFHSESIDVNVYSSLVTGNGDEIVAEF